LDLPYFYNFIPSLIFKQFAEALSMQDSLGKLSSNRSKKVPC
jgi:hypothetical protein